MEDGYEPRVNKRRPITGDILELDDYPYGRDNLPDLPPRMPELSNSRGQMYKEPSKLICMFLRASSVFDGLRLCFMMMDWNKNP